MRRFNPYESVLLALAMAAALGACTASEVRDTAARTALAIMRSGCHAAGNCGVSCPAGTTLDETTLACTPAPR